jgi:O-methyltransferase
MSPFLKHPLRSFLTLKEKDIRFELLIRVVQKMYPGYRLTWPYLDWWADEWFNDYLDHFDERSGMNTHRHWELFQLMKLVERVPGDTAECGAFRGAGSFLICERNNRNKYFSRWHHIFDSFEGLSRPTDKDGAHWSPGDLRSGVEELEENLSPFDRYKIYPGWIPDRFKEVEDQDFAFVHIDVDLYSPTKDSVEFFYPRLAPGGILLCDDYGCTTCPGATEAIDVFIEGKPEEIISMAAGGGFIVKGPKA